MAEPRERMEWAEVGLAARTLAERVLDDDYRPDMLLSIARGGLVVGGTLAYALGVKNTFTMNVEFYVGVDERLPVPMILPPVPELVDLGRTLALVQDFCAGRVGETRVAVLYEKPHSIVRCEYVWRRTDRWIDFPWSAHGPVEVPGQVAARAD